MFHPLCNISISKVIFHSDVSEDKELDHVLNFTCIMGKYHIHKARYLNLYPAAKYLLLYIYLFLFLFLFFCDEASVSCKLGITFLTL